MKKIISFMLIMISLALVSCTAGDGDTTDTQVLPQTDAVTVTETETEAATETELETETEAVTTEPGEQIKLPDHYVDFRDEQNVYACSNPYNVTTEYTGDGMKIKFLPSNDGKDPTYCFDPYITLPLPAGKFSVDEYPFFVIMLYTSRDDMKGDIRYKTDGLKNGASYPTYRFSYGGTGDRKIVLNLKDSSVLFRAAEDQNVTGYYNNLRMDMFENNANTTDTFVIYCYAFFKTLSEANCFDGLPDTGKDKEDLPDLSAYYKGAEFAKPDAKYKPKKLLYGFERGNYDFAVRKLENNGYGGIVTNVNFNQRYLKDDSEFELLSDAFRYAGSLGLHLWIYDEYQWPSGKAFGQVLEGHDEFEATGVELITLKGNGDIKYALPDKYIKIVGADLINGGKKTSLETDGKTLDIKHEGSYTVYVYARRITNQGKEDPTDFTTLRDVDLLNYDAVSRFIEITYQRYKDKMGDAFELAEAFFTDEPLLGNRDMKNYVVWTDKLPAKFTEMHGYDIESELYSLYDGKTEHDRLVRVNFYQTVALMFRETYFEQIAEWCEKNGVASSGHMLFEENIQRHIETYGGDFMQLCGAMTIPGGDILQTEPDRLLTEGTDIGSDMGLKYVSSAAKNAGKTKVHLEFTPSAVAGAPFFSEPGKYTIAGSTLASFFGANTYSVICGENDIPAADLKRFTTYAGRIHTLLDTAVTATNIGVFYPVDSVRAGFTATGDHFNYAGSDEPAVINRLMQHTCLEMLKGGYDFTVLDDQSVAAAEIKDGKMYVGLGEYSVLVMPDVSVLSLHAAEKLAEFKAAGGKIIWLGCTPAMCTERNGTEQFKTVISKIKGAVFTGKIADELSKYAKIPMDAKLKSGVFITEYKRTDDGKMIVYLANSSNSVKAVNLGDGYDKYYIYDPYDCTVTEASGQTTVAVPKYRAVLIVTE